MAVAIEEGINKSVDFFWEVAEPTGFRALAGVLTPCILVTALQPFGGMVFGAMMGFSSALCFEISARVIDHYTEKETLKRYALHILAFLVSNVASVIFATLLVTGAGIATMAPSVAVIFSLQLIAILMAIHTVWFCISTGGEFLIRCLC